MIVKRMMLRLVLLTIALPKLNFAQDDESRKFGYYTDRAMVLTQTILFNEASNNRINEIGNRLVKASDTPDMPHTFRVINDPTINAYATSGGFVYITTGLLDILESEDELAAIIAHEIGHTSKDHPINFIYESHESAKKGRIVGLGLAAVLGYALGEMAEAGSKGYYYYPTYTTQQAIDLGFKLGESIGNSIAVSMIKGYGKEQELESDALAVQYTHKAGYDPNALVAVFKKLMLIRDELEINEKNYISSVINAEPGLEQRLKSVEEIIAK